MSNTPRIYKNLKRIALAFSAIAGTTATQLIGDSTGNTRFDISDVNWQRIVMIGSLDSIAATSVTSITFSLLTTNKVGNTGSTSDVAATKADGSTAFAKNVTATGTFGTSTGKIASTGATAALVGGAISVLATLDSSVTSASGSIDLYIEGQ
jgi:hypothetical protein